jgi:DNA modification methylase
MIVNCDYKQIDIAKVDFVLSDPPYNIGFKYDSYKDTKKAEDYINMIGHFKGKKCALIHYPEETMKYFVPALGCPDSVMAWCYNSNLNRQFRLISFWGCSPDLSKVKQPYKNPTDKRVKKLIEAGSEGRNSYNWISDIQLVKNVSKEKTIHPCPIPVELAKRIILFCTEPGQVIYDPFCGSGSVCVAAKMTGRKFIGTDISKDYCEVAVKRLAEIK